MNRHQLGQTVYWIKYTNDLPELRSFVVNSIKQSADGYKYSDGRPAAAYIHESKCFDSIDSAVINACRLAKELLKG